MAQTLSDFVKLINLANRAEAERLISQNFDIIYQLLINGATGTFTSGVHTLTITKGIVTGIT